ncbi:hypothetical protein LCGC14_1495020, partial [marine sediment metagenome]
MALTGLDIYKNLPKENCKECGLPTCLAFAMKVASGQAGLDDCPRLSDEARGALGEASAPPQRLVKIGPDANAVEVGQETVMYRHDEKFHNPTVVALTISDAGETDAIREACQTFKGLEFTRVGQIIRPEMIALMNDSDSPDTFKAVAELIHGELGVPMVLIGKIESVSAAATGPLAGARPLLYCRGEVTADQLAELADAAKAPVCVAGDLASVAETVEALTAKGVKDIVISPA